MGNGWKMLVIWCSVLGLPLEASLGQAPEHANKPVAPADSRALVANGGQSVAERLKVLAECLAAIERDKAVLSEREKKAFDAKDPLNKAPKPTPEELAAMDKEIADSKAVLAKHEADLEQAIEGVTGLTDAESSEVDLDREFKEILKAGLDSFKDVFASQRRLAELRQQIEQREKKLEKFDAALKNVRTLRDAAAQDPKNEKLREFLNAREKELETRRAHLPVEITNLQVLADQLQSEKKPWTQYASDLLRDTIMRRVWNLILAVVAFVGVLLLFRLFHRWLVAKSFLRRMGVSVFLIRLLEVFYYIISAVAAGLAGFLVLYASEDWFLLTLAMLALAGLLLAGRHTLPKLYEQGKLMLNLGSAREGERIIVKGLPWLVKRINVYCELANPSLTGGEMRLALRELSQINSRPFAKNERWFPTEENDWVMLDDGLLGRVVLQTPEFVQVMPNGGSLKTYGTLAFLEQNPRNLSHSFRLTSIFGLDYRHAAQAIEKIPQCLRRRLLAELRKLAGEDHLVDVQVELSQAGPSSLDFTILADFKGGAAHRYAELQRLIQRTCVDEALKQNWTIPFPQMVLHQAPTPAKPHHETKSS